MDLKEASTNPVIRGIKYWFGPLARSKVWLATLSLLLDLPIGIATFTIVVTLLSLSGGLVVTLIGIPLLAVTVLSGRAIAAFERQRSAIFLELKLPAPAKFDYSKPSLSTMWSALKDEHGWKGLLYGFIALPLGILNFTVAVTLWVVAISFSLSVFGLPFISHGDNTMVHFDSGAGHWNIVPWSFYSGWALFLMYLGTTLFGLFLLGLAPRIIDVFTKVKVSALRILCAESEKEALNQRVSVLEETRSASVKGAANELRRIERDLHDGAQQHLVSVAMQLGIAKERLAESGNPELSEIVDSAHRDAKAAIAELRNLVRGIHPSVLTDRGLDAAISALASRSTVPVEIHYEVKERLPATAELTAYFVIAESLTNIAKHSGATHAVVRVTQEGDRAIVEVSDNGRGGAAESEDGGLRGLEDRVRGIDGILTLLSPLGGPTKVIVELPCV